MLDISKITAVHLAIAIVVPSFFLAHCLTSVPGNVLLAFAFACSLICKEILTCLTFSLGDTMLSLEDLVDESETSTLPLTVTRIYSAYIHKRRTVGPMGTGWLLNFW